ncbi:hypothetical protein HPB50_014743 [Hyalomma asiaticum]|uniref:Uncharacterized protein n=1 Tax=Hyalomma asiaticum TaxID=266040 RepID=A0ACB7SBR0_HYAAI|nr:hypothetical protein HPB50_014743 [Hyalomma asiaticum]
MPEEYSFKAPEYMLVWTDRGQLGLTSVFQKKSYRADEYLRTVMENNELELAVQQCIDAAAHEYQPKTQKKLLRAACFGKSFVQGMNPSSFVETCRLLRVLNAVRDHMVGLPLTYTQLQCLSIDVLLDRLVLRQHYYLALKIARYLRIPDLEGTSRILAHWACYKVAQLHIPTDEVAKAISEKLDSSPGILYSEIARKAVDCGRQDLAIKQTEDQMRLMRYQLKLEDKFNDKFLDLSVHETMQRLMEIREMKLAEELCKDFKMLLPRFWWLKIKVLANEKHWTELEKFSKSKKSPIGYECLHLSEIYNRNVN